MDKNWKNKDYVPRDCLSCILCKAVIGFEKKEKKKYVIHMQKDHGVFYNINLILIINIMDRQKVLKLIDRMQNEVSEKKHLKSRTSQTETLGRNMETQTDQSLQPNNELEILEVVSQLLSKSSIDNLPANETENTLGDDDNIPITDLELEEAIQVPQIKKEAIPTDKFLDDETDFNILDVTNDDIIETPVGPIPIQDYSNLHPEKIIESANPEKESPREVVEGNNTMVNKRKMEAESSMITEYLVNTSEYFKKQKGKEAATAGEERALTFTETDPTLPKGWRARSRLRGNGRKDWEFLSPELKVLRSRVGVVEYMRTMGGYTHEEISRVCPAIKIKKERR